MRYVAVIEPGLQIPAEAPVLEQRLAQGLPGGRPCVVPLDEASLQIDLALQRPSSEADLQALELAVIEAVKDVIPEAAGIALWGEASEGVTALIYARMGADSGAEGAAYLGPGVRIQVRRHGGRLPGQTGTSRREGTP